MITNCINIINLILVGLQTAVLNKNTFVLSFFVEHESVLRTVENFGLAGILQLIPSRLLQYCTTWMYCIDSSLTTYYVEMTEKDSRSLKS